MNMTSVSVLCGDPVKEAWEGHCMGLVLSNLNNPQERSQIEKEVNPVLG